MLLSIPDQFLFSVLSLVVAGSFFKQMHRQGVKLCFRSATWMKFSMIDPNISDSSVLCFTIETLGIDGVSDDPFVWDSRDFYSLGKTTLIKVRFVE